MIFNLIGFILVIITLILIEINIVGASMESAGVDTPIDENDGIRFSFFEKLPIRIITLILCSFIWYVLSVIFLILVAFYIFDDTQKREMQDFWEQLKDSLPDFKKIFKFRLNIVKFLKIKRIYLSTDEETRSLGLETLRNYMKWDEEELNTIHKNL